MYRTEAAMFASGSKMLFDVPATWLALNVDGMTCIRPRDALPAAALLSQLLMALGLPPDSCFIRRRNADSLPGLHPQPPIFRAVQARADQRLAPVPPILQAPPPPGWLSGPLPARPSLP